MFDFVPDIRRSDVVVKTLRVVFDDNLAFAFTLILSLNKLFLQSVICEGFHKRTEFLFLIVSG